MERIRNENNITELVFIVDESGSMSGLESDTIGGINAMIEKQKKIDGKVYVTTVLFSNDSKTVHDRVDIGSVEPMTDRDYTPHGCTALLDALGSTMKHIEKIHSYIRHEDIPEHTVFVITTDGMENASRTYSVTEVRERISYLQDEMGWEFLFLAANIDAIGTAADYGIKRERAAQFRASSEGVREAYSNACYAVCSLRENDEVDEDWNIDLQ